MDFGLALAVIKAGGKVTRTQWNGKNMWIALNPGSKITVSEGRPLAAVLPVGTPVEFQPYLIMRTAQKMIVPWVATQSDVLGEDWIVVEGVDKDFTAPLVRGT